MKIGQLVANLTTSIQEKKESKMLQNGGARIETMRVLFFRKDKRSSSPTPQK